MYFDQKTLEERDAEKAAANDENAQLQKVEDWAIVRFRLERIDTLGRESY